MALRPALRVVALGLLPALLLAAGGPGWARFFCQGEQALVASPCCDEGRDLRPDSVAPSTCCVSAGGEMALDQARPAAPSLEPLPPPVFKTTVDARPPASLLTSVASKALPSPTGPPILQRTRALLI